ncbi:M48 family metallopeptidase [Candidatus Uhrbacteria bacterium]|nr:M48 family metallopeptidase [Candidatus Uhrbacteria bacterium]
MNIYDEIARNSRRTVLTVIIFLVALLCIVFVATFIILSDELSLQDALSVTIGVFPWVSGFATILVLIWTLISYHSGDKLILRFVNARPVERKDYFDLYNTVENTAITAGLPTPKIYLINDSSMNAFATGRNPNHSVICFTTGIVERLSKQELEAVAAHEMAHIANYDILLQLIVVTVVGIIAMIGEIMIRAGGHNRKGSGIAVAGLFVLLVGYPLLLLTKLSLSRRREYMADATGAFYTRDPHSLADALAKISTDARVESADSMKAAAHLFIDDPSIEEGRQHTGISWFAKLLSTHPPVQDRINRLRGTVP